MADAALRLTALAEELLGERLSVRIRAWDGSESGPPGAPVLVIHSRRALRRLLWKPGELGLARAWVAGELDIEGDLYEALDLMASLIWDRGVEAKDSVHPVRDPKVRAFAKGLLRSPPLAPAAPAARGGTPPRRHPPHQAPRQGGHQSPLRRGQ